MINIAHRNTQDVKDISNRETRQMSTSESFLKLTFEITLPWEVYCHLLIAGHRHSGKLAALSSTR
jgi:hypothetical protein